MSEPLSDARHAFACVSCGFSQMPIFNKFWCATEEAVLIGAYVASEKHLGKYSLLQFLRSRSRSPISREAALDLTHTMLARYGMTRLRAPDSESAGFPFIVSDSPKILSHHDQLASIQIAREIVLAAGLNPEATA